MAFNEALAARVREALSDARGISEKRMFGGLCFLVRGNLCCGVDADELFVRASPEAGEKLLARKHARAFAPAGRPMRGWVAIGRAGIRDRRSLRSWLQPALDFATSLPNKPGARSRAQGKKR